MSCMQCVLHLTIDFRRCNCIYKLLWTMRSEYQRLLKTNLRLASPNMIYWKHLLPTLNDILVFSSWEDVERCTTWRSESFWWKILCDYAVMNQYSSTGAYFQTEVWWAYSDCLYLFCAESLIFTQINTETQISIFRHHLVGWLIAQCQHWYLIALVNAIHSLQMLKQKIPLRSLP